MEAVKSVSAPEFRCFSTFHEESSETCSGPSCSVDGDDTNSRASCSMAGDDVSSRVSCSADADDTISLCSWTTDQGDDLDSSNMFSESVGMGYEHTAPNQFYQDAQNSAAMPMISEMWYEPIMVPAYQFYYVVAPGNWCGDETGSKKSRNSKKGKKAAWSHAEQYAPYAQEPIAFDVAARESGSETKSCSNNGKVESSQQTTVILRNFPIEYTRNDLLRLLDDEGFSAAYDFVHLPIDFQKQRGLGYAIVNMVSHQMALSIWEHFTGFDRWDISHDGVCEVAWNNPHQGLAAHIDRYRNSPLMHESVPDAYRPAVFDHGLRVEFAAPTSRIRAPRIRHQKDKDAPTISESM